MDEKDPNISILYNHYVIIDDKNRVIDMKVSSRAIPVVDNTSLICINENGGETFYLFPDKAEVTALFNENGIPLYEWDGTKVVARKKTAISADKDAVDISEPTSVSDISDATPSIPIPSFDDDLFIPNGGD